MRISFLSHLSRMKNTEAFNGKMGLNQNFGYKQLRFMEIFKTWLQLCHGTYHTEILKQRGHRCKFAISPSPLKALQSKISTNSLQVHPAFPFQQNFSLLHEDIAVPNINKPDTIKLLIVHKSVFLLYSLLGIFLSETALLVITLVTPLGEKVKYCENNLP